MASRERTVATTNEWVEDLHTCGIVLFASQILLDNWSKLG